MKRIALAALMLLPLGCGSDPQRPAADVDLEIHLQTGFSETLVWVNVDGSEVFHGCVTTGRVLAYAAIIPVRVEGPWHHVAVSTGDRALAEADFGTGTPYIGVQYDPATREVSWNPSKDRFHYR